MTTVNASLLAQYVAAEEKILKGQSYRMGDRWVTRADLQFVQAERRRLQQAVNAETLAASGGRNRFAGADFVGGGRGPEGFTY